MGDGMAAASTETEAGRRAKNLRDKFDFEHAKLEALGVFKQQFSPVQEK